MFNLFLALHVLAAVFAIGPLAHATTTAGRGIRTGDGAATAASARTATIYSYASVLVVLLGFGLMSTKDGRQALGECQQTWIWLSLLLWLASVALTLGVIVPTLTAPPRRHPTAGIRRRLTARVAASGGMVGLLFAVIVFLMVYQPGR